MAGDGFAIPRERQRVGVPSSSVACVSDNPSVSAAEREREREREGERDSRAKKLKTSAMMTGYLLHFDTCELDEEEGNVAAMRPIWQRMSKCAKET